MFNPYTKERLYIAGPECFYPRGYSLWWAQRKLAEYYGIQVVLPTDTNLKLNNKDLRLNAKEIFDDLIVQVNKTTAIIADLDSFRGCEPDGGTVFELGWICSKKGRMYGYSRDCRSIVTKNQKASIVKGIVIDEYGNPHPYADLPFCPSIVASTKIIEGSFNEALKMYISDLDEERKYGKAPVKELKVKIPLRKNVYIASAKRYEKNATEYFSSLKRAFEKERISIVTPIDSLPEFPVPQTEDPFKLAAWRFKTNLALLNAADIIVADLSDYRGFEPNNDVAFECGYAYGKGKKCFACMPDIRTMQQRIPQRLEGGDIAGNVVENFDLPINLMFGTYFDIRKSSVLEMVPVVKKALIQTN